jgi:hypothetical protein
MWSHDLKFETGFLLKFVLICLSEFSWKWAVANLVEADWFACFFGVKRSHLKHCFHSESADKTPQHFNASLFTIWVAVVSSFLTIDARMGRIMKMGVLQNTRPSSLVHYSVLACTRASATLNLPQTYSLHWKLEPGKVCWSSHLSEEQMVWWIRRTFAKTYKTEEVI